MATISERSTMIGRQRIGQDLAEDDRATSDWPSTTAACTNSRGRSERNSRADQPRHRRPGDDRDGARRWSRSTGGKIATSTMASTKLRDGLEELGEAHERVVDARRRSSRRRRRASTPSNSATTVDTDADQQRDARAIGDAGGDVAARACRCRAGSRMLARRLEGRAAPCPRRTRKDRPARSRPPRPPAPGRRAPTTAPRLRDERAAGSRRSSPFTHSIRGSMQA